MIAAGEESDVIGKIFNGKKVGTLFLPEKVSLITAAITTTMNDLLLNDSNNNNNNGLKTSSSLASLLQLPSTTTTTTADDNNSSSSTGAGGMTEESIEELAKTVRSNSRILQSLSSQERTNILLKIVEYLHEESEVILHANMKDMEKAEKK